MKTTTTAEAPPAAPRRPRGEARDHTTVSGRPVEALYSAPDVAEVDYDRDLGDPGRFPYTRGIHPAGYGGKLWTMRQFAGYGTPEETNARYRELQAAGGTGLSVAFDLPTLMGRDPDHELSLGEVGKCGVNVASVADMERLFDGIALDRVTTSMTINSPAAMIFAMYLVAAERQGVDWSVLSGTIQNDILKEYIAQKEYIYPPRPSMRLVTDVFAFCADHVPRWNTISVSGYHIREAGATALQELAFTLRDGIEYVQHGVDAGLAGGPVRAAHLVLLQRAQRLLRGDRQVPRRAQALGDGHARAIRGRGRALVEAALPRSDRRRLADRPAALQQRRPDRRPGPGRRPRRDELAPHQLARRGARPARPRGGAPGAAGRSRSSPTRAASRR